MRTQSQKGKATQAFQDRAAAGRTLASRLMHFAARPDVVVLALPPGGVPVGYEIAQTLVAPLDVFLLRELPTPGHPEIVMGTLASGGILMLNPDVVHEFNISEAQIQALIAQVQRELETQERQYRSNHPALKIRGHKIILVDDGFAAPHSMPAASRAVRNHGPYWITIAMPVLSSPLREELRGEFDELVWLCETRDLATIGRYYRHLPTVSDEEIRELVAQSAHNSRAA